MRAAKSRPTEQKKKKKRPKERSPTDIGFSPPASRADLGRATACLGVGNHPKGSREPSGLLHPNVNTRPISQFEGVTHIIDS